MKKIVIPPRNTRAIAFFERLAEKKKERRARIEARLSEIALKIKSGNLFQ